MLKLIPVKYYLYGAIVISLLVAYRWHINKVAEAEHTKGYKAGIDAQLKADQIGFDKLQKQIDGQRVELEQSEIQLQQSQREALVNRDKLIRETNSSLSNIKSAIENNQVEVAKVPASELEAKIRQQLAILSSK